MRLFRIFREEGGVLYAPYEDYEYGCKEEIIGKTFFCDMFDDDPSVACSRGFYGFDLIALDKFIYRVVGASLMTYVLAEIEASGRIVEISDSKIRCEKMKIVRYYEGDEIPPLIDEISWNFSWDIKGFFFPTHPHSREPKDLEVALYYLKRFNKSSDWIMKDFLIENATSHEKHYPRLDSFFRYGTGSLVCWWYSFNDMIDAYTFRCLMGSFVLDTAEEEEQFKRCRSIAYAIAKIMDLGYVVVSSDKGFLLLDKYGNEYQRR